MNNLHQSKTYAIKTLIERFTMKKPFAFLLIFALCLSSAPSFAQQVDYYDEDEEDLPESELTVQSGEDSSFGSADATAISMGIWGIALALGIGIAATLISSSGSSSN